MPAAGEGSGSTVSENITQKAQTEEIPPTSAGVLLSPWTNLFSQSGQTSLPPSPFGISNVYRTRPLTHASDGDKRAYGSLVSPALGTGDTIVSADADDQHSIGHQGRALLTQKITAQGKELLRLRAQLEESSDLIEGLESQVRELESLSREKTASISNMRLAYAKQTVHIKRQDDRLCELETIEQELEKVRDSRLSALQASRSLQKTAEASSGKIEILERSTQQLGEKNSTLTVSLTAQRRLYQQLKVRHHEMAIRLQDQEDVARRTKAALRQCEDDKKLLDQQLQTSLACPLLSSPMLADQRLDAELSPGWDCSTLASQVTLNQRSSSAAASSSLTAARRAEGQELLATAKERIKVARQDVGISWTGDDLYSTAITSSDEDEGKIGQAISSSYQQAGRGELDDCWVVGNGSRTSCAPKGPRAFSAACEMETDTITHDVEAISTNASEGVRLNKCEEQLETSQGRRALEKLLCRSLGASYRTR